MSSSGILLPLEHRGLDYKIVDTFCMNLHRIPPRMGHIMFWLREFSIAVCVCLHLKKVSNTKRWPFYWSVVDLQCCADFCLQQSDSVLHAYICSFSYSFTLLFLTGYWVYFFVLYNRTFFFVHFICLYLLIPNSLSPTSLPLDNNKSVLYVCSLFLFCRQVDVDFCHILDFTVVI